MKHLVIYCHPSPKSFCHAIFHEVTESLRSKGHDVVERDLYALGFDPVLKGSDFDAFLSGKTPSDIKVEQDYVAWSQGITVIYPVWWTGLPAMLKGYFDRVLSLGFAYIFETQGPKPLLGGRKVMVFCTQGQFKEAYDASGMTDAMQKTTDIGIFSFCGMDVVEHKFFGAVTSADEATRRNYLAEVRELMGRL